MYYTVQQISKHYSICNYKQFVSCNVTLCNATISRVTHLNAFGWDRVNKTCNANVYYDTLLRSNSFYLPLTMYGNPHMMGHKVKICIIFINIQNSKTSQIDTAITHTEHLQCKLILEMNNNWLTKNKTSSFLLNDRHYV